MGFTGVPLAAYSKEDQNKVADRIELVCGSPPRCPPDAVPEQWLLDYIRLRAEVRAAGGH